jgi:hypothetical protein
MENDQIHYLRHRLQRYEESIRETEEHFNELESFGRYRACAPYYEKSGIPLLIDVLETDTLVCDTFWQEYDRITGKLKAFDTIKGQIYRDLLWGDLKNYVSAYHTTLCFIDLNMIATESIHDLMNRDAIRVLISELRRGYDIAETENLVMTLDEIFLRMCKSTDQQPDEKTPIANCKDHTTHCYCEYSIAGWEKEQTRFS